MGFCMLPLLPVAFECGVECTYPMDEETPSGILMFGGQVGSPRVYKCVCAVL